MACSWQDKVFIMLELVAQGASMPKAACKKAMTEFDFRLGILQRQLRTAGIPVLIVFEGWDAAGKGSALGRLVHAFDPRGFKVHHVNAATDVEMLFPPMHRFWRMLPARGDIAFFNHSWYRHVINEPLENNLNAAELHEVYARIRRFEHQLTDDGAVLIKFFLHISREEQAKRFKKMMKDPAYSWKVGKVERQRHKRYDRYADYVEDMLRETSMPRAVWNVIPAANKHLRDYTIAGIVLEALEQALEHRKPSQRLSVQPEIKHDAHVLDEVDLSLAVEKKAYEKALPELQEELRRLQHLCYAERRPVVIVFEGADAGGKGGAIRRLTWRLDPRGYEVIPVGAPEGEEKRKHYLWRFWRSLCKSGHFTIFDRSWYGRVMVERVEGFASTTEWMRAYREINEFEEDLLDYGAVLCKFWMHISKEEQLRRFEARKATPEKQWKITDEDWRNREKWDRYNEALCDMIANNSTLRAPWTIVEGNDKRHARLKVLNVVIERIHAAIDQALGS